METPRRRVVVVGGGYVGLVTAVGLSHLGHRVRLIESDPRRRASLERGVAPIHEPGLDDALSAALRSGSVEIGDSAEPVDAVLICVGTPIEPDGRSDLSQLRSALQGSAGLSPDAPLVIRSTLPPGGTRQVLEWADRPASRILTNPEFLRQGSALSDFLAPSRIVIGRGPGVDEAALAMVVGLYDRLEAAVLVVDYAAAELIKNGANAFLAMRLSFVNEIAALAEAYGTDVDQVLPGLTSDPRIGSAYMRPSFGFGGSCLPKELRALEAAGSARGLRLHVASAAADANASQQERFARRIDRALGGVRDRRIALLGLAFKADTDDIRESPSLALATRLLEGGAIVVAHDPQAGGSAARAEPRLTLADSADDAIEGADAVVIATDWPEYRELDWRRLAGRLHGDLVFDGRRHLDPELVREAGLRYEAVGTASEDVDVGDRPEPARSEIG
jgi:UDPglucose 6-dehydrogenase